MSLDHKMNSQHNYLNKYSRVSPNSPDWAKLEYLLQLSLGSTTVVVTNIWAISNPHMNLNFGNRT
jgi:hypothetical protein